MALKIEAEVQQIEKNVEYHIPVNLQWEEVEKSRQFEVRIRHPFDDRIKFSIHAGEEVIIDIKEITGLEEYLRSLDAPKLLLMNLLFDSGIVHEGIIKLQERVGRGEETHFPISERLLADMGTKLHYSFNLVKSRDVPDDRCFHESLTELLC